MGKENYIDYDPEVMANMKAASVGFEYPNDEPEDIQAEIDSRAAALVWSLLSRLSTVKSTATFALWMVVCDEPPEVSKKARELQVSKQAVSLAIVRARKKLEQAQAITVEPSDSVNIPLPTRKQIEAYSQARDIS